MLEQHTVEELFRVRDKAGYGLLHHALRRDFPAWEPLLAAGWPVAKETGWTPQHEAVLIGDVRALEELSRHGADLTVRESKNGGTLLHIAAFNGHLEVVQLLVRAGVPVNARDKDGWTALSQARDQGFPKIMNWLKQHGATR